VETDGISERELTGLDARVQAEIDEATDLAERSPMPDPSDALVGVYADG
jgi:TPP-dependent pyruvate/acetoin dehydrogenase alpha subunit